MKKETEPNGLQLKKETSVKNHSPHLPPADWPVDKKMEFLEEKIKQLNYICLELNPYQPITGQMKKKLRQFFITDHYDPFAITNKLLVFLDEADALLEELEECIENNQM